MLIGTLNGLTVAFVPFLTASFVSLVVRYRTGSWLLRQQIKHLDDCAPPNSSHNDA